MLTREQIARRAARELASGETVYLAPGLAELVVQHLPQGAVQSQEPGADVAVVTAREVSAEGELASADDACGAKRVIALIEQHVGEDGESAVRAQCREAPNGRAARVITNLAVFDVTPEGLVIREVAQGISGHDVQLKSQAPLLAADDLRVVDLG